MSKTSPLNFRPAKRETATAFDRAIWPLGRDEFLSKFWRQSFTRITGQEGRFTSFFSWEILNYILEHHPLEPPLLRLFRDGKSVDPVHYFLSLPNGTKRLKPASLVAFLSQGATLILDDVHELAPSLLEVIEAFKDALQANTTINLYAGWGTQKGFDLHWDTQDTMILQVSGRKHWKV
jgi:Cupin superfamily protein